MTCLVYLTLILLAWFKIYFLEGKSYLFLYILCILTFIAHFLIVNQLEVRLIVLEQQKYLATSYVSSQLLAAIANN